VIFTEHFGENRLILLQTVAKWRCIKLCAIFLDHSVFWQFCLMRLLQTP